MGLECTAEPNRVSAQLGEAELGPQNGRGFVKLKDHFISAHITLKS